MQSTDTSAPNDDALAEQAASFFIKAFGDHPGFRLAHAKGIVTKGTFTPSSAAAQLSKAAHFQGASVPVIVRFSNPTGIPNIPDSDPNANPKGMAIRFVLPGGAITDIVSNGQSGFVAGTAADFVGFFAAAISTRPDSAKPTPLETFLAAHPRTAAFLAQPLPSPASFATQAFFGNNSFIFVNAGGQRQAVRYFIVPVAGERSIDPKVAAAGTPNFIFDELKSRLAQAPVEFKFLAQLAAPGDPTSDATKVWPDDRKKVDLGTIRITSIDPDSAAAERALFLDPVHLVDGIELSDDPLPAFRSKVYSISISHRT